MGRYRRHVVTGEVYEICFRAKSGLPFVIYALINLLIQSVVARVQRDCKVELCHDIWNGSHPHIIVVAKDQAGVSAFAGQIEKRITDCMKRLLGLSSLLLWDGRARIIPLLDAETVSSRIAYLYANPAKDNIVDSIDLFPGVSSWRDYKAASQEVSSEVTNVFPNIRLKDLPLLPSRRLTHRQDTFYTNRITDNAETFHKLVRKPNAWMPRFGVVSSEHVREINNRILEKIEILENTARETRRIEGKSLFSRSKLLSQPVLKEHTPPPKEGSVLSMASDKSTKIEYRKKFKAYDRECSDCYQRELLGDRSVKWPPGAFKPPSRQPFNLLARSERVNDFSLVNAELIYRR